MVATGENNVVFAATSARSAVEEGGPHTDRLGMLPQTFLHLARLSTTILDPLSDKQYRRDRERRSSPESSGSAQRRPTITEVTPTPAKYRPRGRTRA